MPEWLQALILFSAGLGLGLLAFIAGAWVMYRGKALPGTGEGFLKDPKGEVFTIPEVMDDETRFPGQEEPSREEQNILKKTQNFLKVLEGRNDA